MSNKQTVVAIRTIEGARVWITEGELTRAFREEIGRVLGFDFPTLLEIHKEYTKRGGYLPPTVEEVRRVLF